MAALQVDALVILRSGDLRGDLIKNGLPVTGGRYQPGLAQHLEVVRE